MSGYENIVRMGILMGMTKSQITAKIPDIETSPRW
jgi:hypothetical protein